MDNNPTRDPLLWKIARKRAGFKKSLFTYLVVIAFMWFIWYFTEGHEHGWGFIPWPLWVMVGWGLGLAFQYFDSYGPNRADSVEKEYEKLKKEKEVTNKQL